MKHIQPMLSLLGTLLALSCAAIDYHADSADYRKQIRQYEERTMKDPGDAQAVLDLGICFFQLHEYPKAKEYLKKASAMDTHNAKTFFYYGMTLEADSSLAEALAVYFNYSDFSPLSPYRKLMQGRYDVLSREVIQRQLQTLLSKEDSLNTRDLSPTTIAVFPLVYRGSDEKFSALGLGFSEMMIIDLKRVEQLRLVERIRIEELLRELQFGQSRQVDPATAPRLGKLLSAGRIVGGAYSVSNERQIRLDVATWNLPAQEHQEPTSQTDDLENIFRMQKDIVFGIVKKMGITLTRAEIERIQIIPTKNLQAFLLYSKGLEKENARDFKAAEVYYRSAVELDPDFSIAKNKVDAVESLSLAGGSTLNALLAARQIEPPIPTPLNGPVQIDLITNRLQSLGDGLGSGFTVGADSRKPVEEAAQSGAPVTILPPPPPPPPER